jgi:hypothetical protein
VGQVVDAQFTPGALHITQLPGAGTEVIAERPGFGLHVGVGLVVGNREGFERSAST